MARSQSNGAGKFVGAAAVAIVGGVAIGYLVGGARAPQVGEQIAQPPPPVVSTPAPSVAPPIQHPRPTNGDYTAPGAPRIAIREESAPILRRVTQPSTASPDPEATQEAAPPARHSANVHTAGTGSPPPAASGDDNAGSSASPADTGNNSAASPAPDSGATPAPVPADPDFERVGKPAASESGQEDSGKAQFRVQTGSYTEESDARSLADELRGKGYTTSTRSEREGDHLIYKVQVGAYRTKAGAGKAADDLQKKGYPAYISPINP